MTLSKTDVVGHGTKGREMTVEAKGEGHERLAGRHIVGGTRTTGNRAEWGKWLYKWFPLANSPRTLERGRMDGSQPQTHLAETVRVLLSDTLPGGYALDVQAQQFITDLHWRALVYRIGRILAGRPDDIDWHLCATHLALAIRDFYD